MSYRWAGAGYLERCLKRVFCLVLAFCVVFCFLVLVLVFAFFFRAVPAAYGSSLARGRIRAIAAGVHHSHSNAGSEPHLVCTPQLMETLDP